MPLVEYKIYLSNDKQAMELVSCVGDSGEDAGLQW